MGNSTSSESTPPQGNSPSNSGGGGQAEPLRRRLTVGLTDTNVNMMASPAGQEKTGELLQTLETGVIADHVVDASGNKINGCVVVTSKTDRDANRRKSFFEKDREAAQAPASLAELGIGVVCKKGQKPESPNQDSFAMVMGPSTDPFRVFGVFDGHGPLGHDVSSFAVDTLMKRFLGNTNRYEDPEGALTDAFITVQQLLDYKTAQRELDSSVSGSTCTVAYLPANTNELFVAYCGDSRSILQRQEKGSSSTKDLTVDHKPNNPQERARIEKAGGRVVFDGYFNYRVYSRDGRGGLNMSRALGDGIAHQAGVSEVPETSRHTLTTAGAGNRDIFLLLCTDGVWEFIESKDAAAMVESYGRKNVQEAVEVLAKESYDKWMEDSDGEISDDITAMLIWL